MTDDDRGEQDDPAGSWPPDGPHPDDPDAAALDRTRADLAAHGARTPGMPADLLGDIGRALAAERAGAGGRGEGPDVGDVGDTVVRDTGVITDIRAARDATARPRRRRLLAVAALAAAAAAAVVVTVVVGGVTPPGGAPVPTPAPTAAPAPDAPRLSSGDGVSALRAGLGRSEYGPLAGPGRLDGCLAAHGLAPGTRPAGARQVVVDGRPGVLLVLPTGVAARFRLLVVEPGCGPGAPLTVSDTLVGR